MQRWLLAIAVIAMQLAPARADDVRPPDPPPPARRTGVVTRPPRLVQAQAPEYPPAALEAGKEASVKVRIHIDATGVVTAVDVVEPAGDGFDEAAVAAAMQYVFEPAEIDGAPAAIAVETAIHFTIERREEPEAPPPPPPAAHTGPPNHAGALTAPVSLQGAALERGTRRALAGVIVSIAELGLDAVTGDDGTFYFHGVPPGNYKLLAVDPRYDRLERPVALAKQEAVEVRLWMRPRGGNPYETVVEGEREVLEVTRRTIQRQQMTSVPGTFGDPIRVIQTLPGIQRAPFGLGLLLIRGSNPDDTGIYVDGHEVPSLFHFLGGPSIFNAEMLDSLDLYPGGFPARFGRHHGGAVALELRPSQSDGVHGSAKIDFIDSGGYLRAPITRDLSIAVAGRRSYIDLFLGFVLPQPAQGGQRIVTPVYYDYSARVDYNLHDNGRLSLFVIGSSDTLHVLNKDPDAELSTDLNSAVKFLRVIGGYERPIAGDLKLTLSPAWGRDTVTFAGAQAEAAGPFSSISVVNDSLSYRMRVHGKLAPSLTIDSGLDLLSRVTRYQALLPVDDQLIDSRGVDIPPTQLFRGAQLIGLGSYIDLGVDVSSRLKLIPSLRIDGYLLDGVARNSIDPRLVARYQVSPTLTVKAYLGHFSQPPQPEGFDRRFGNPNLDIEHAIHTGIGYEWKPDRLWSIDSELYYVGRYDVAVFTSAVAQNPDGTFSNVNFLSEGKNHSTGLELLIKREISEHAYGWVSYTYSRAFQQSHPDSDVVPTAFDQPHVLNAVASYKPGSGWEIGGRFQLASGRPDTPVIGATYDADTGRYVAIRGTARSIRTPLFLQLDTRVEHDWLYERWSLGLYLDIINVTNRKNVEAVQYDYRFRNSSPITSFPILPTLGVKGTW
ncbi:MAG TPA: TonB-dependent receptor [Kofleriaceae bacterium]|jgi:TonB family protein|nr:TonB-dependent receptor [Kofleriaceae bacterium]